MGTVCLIFGPTFYYFLFTGVTALLNIVTAAFITLRILYYQRYIRKTVGLERNNPYMNIIIICIESSALVIIWNLVYLILAVTNSVYTVIPTQLLVHVYVSRCRFFV